MEESQRDVVPKENATWCQSDLMEKLQSVSLISSEETSKFRESHSEGQLEDLVARRASQTLWSTGNLSEPIPNGFYSILPERGLKELFDVIPSLEELSSWISEGHMLNVVLVDVRKDKKLSMLQQLALTVVRGFNSNPVAAIKKIAGLVSDFHKRPTAPNSDNNVNGTLEEVSRALDNQGIQMLGQIKHGSCHPRAILFKVLADTVGLDSRLVVGFPKGVIDRGDMHKYVFNIVELNSVELLVDLVRHPGQLIPRSSKTIFMPRVFLTGESDSAENDSCDSPLEPNSPVCVSADQIDVEGLSHSEPYIANTFWGRNKKIVPAELRTAGSSPEHPLFRGRGRSILGGHRNSFREYRNDITASRSAGASPIASRRRRRRCISMIPEIGDEVVRVVRAMNDTLKQNRLQMDQVDERYKSSDHHVNLSGFHLDDEDGVSGEKSKGYGLHRRHISCPKAISLPSSPHHRVQAPERSEAENLVRSADMILTWNKVLESSTILNKPLLPFEEWNIDFSELTVGSRVGIGFFGEVFRGTWNGTQVAIKVLLEQDLTFENIEDFCNEISILCRLRHPNVILFLGACTKPPRLSVVTEYMDMGSLYYLIHVSEERNKISLRRRIKMLCDICRGLMCIHRVNIAHRDLKSANCLVNKHWTVKICDFGLSRALSTRPMRDTSSAGTPEWMAPELIRNEPFTEKCDIFSLGVIIWELCTQNKPWDGVPSAQVVYAVGNDGARLEVPDGPLGKLISDCWAEPDQRPSCEEVLSRLLNCESASDSNPQHIYHLLQIENKKHRLQKNLDSVDENTLSELLGNLLLHYVKMHRVKLMNRNSLQLYQMCTSVLNLFRHRKIHRTRRIEETAAHQLEVQKRRLI